MADARLAVVVPTFNAAPFVLDTIASVRRQGSVVSELVVVDNGSVDDTLSLVTAAGVDCEREPVVGAGAARRRGFAMTTARYVMFLDHDDLLVDGALRDLLEAISETGADLVYGASVNAVVPPSGDGPVPSVRHAGEMIRAPLASTSVVDRSAFDRFGPFADDSFSWLHWVTALRDGGGITHPVDRQVCVRRIHGGNLSMQPGAKAVLFALIRARRKAADQ